jgi:hypothetical protein
LNSGPVPIREIRAIRGEVFSQGAHLPRRSQAKAGLGLYINFRSLTPSGS